MNKPTLQNIEAKVVAERYDHEGKQLTACFLTLENGYEVVGHSGCLGGIDYDLELGKEIARGQALEKVWLLEGYLFQQALFEQRNAQ